VAKKKTETIECPEYDALVAGMEAAKAKVKEAGAAAVGALFKQFFAEYPSVTAIGWTQYTPHFNDGEPCEFSVHDFYATTKEGVDFEAVSSLYDDEDEHGFADSYSIKDKGIKAAVARLERSKDDDLFESAFGDHAMVIATPRGFHVSEYSHD
jgi:hypothetical protein